MIGRRFAPADVRRYYDRHTRRFIRLGAGGRVGALHRAVWGPGVTSSGEAFQYVERLIAALAQPLCANGAQPHLIDLGCGIGASLCHLAARLPIRGTGLTISPVQARLAAARITDAQLADRVTCLEADYCDVPPGIAPADLAFAIESFVHGPAAGPVLAAWARIVRPGGLLVICDDIRRPSGDPDAARWIDRFRRGWHVNILLTQEELHAAARDAGFEHLSTADLTPHLDIGRPRDRVVGALVAAAGWLPVGRRRIDYLLGGHALQQCLARGWIGYDFVVFRRMDGPPVSGRSV